MHTVNNVQNSQPATVMRETPAQRKMEERDMNELVGSLAVILGGGVIRSCTFQPGRPTDRPGCYNNIKPREAQVQNR